MISLSIGKKQIELLTFLSARKTYKSTYSQLRSPQLAIPPHRRSVINIESLNIMSKTVNAPLILDNRQIQGNATVYATGNALVCVETGGKRTFVEMVNGSATVLQKLGKTALFLGVNVEIDAMYREKRDAQRMKAGDMGRDEMSATIRDAAETAIHNFLHDKIYNFVM